MTYLDKTRTMGRFETEIVVPNEWIYSTDEENNLIVLIAPFFDNEAHFFPNLVVVTRLYQGEDPREIIDNSIVELTMQLKDLVVVGSNVENDEDGGWSAYIEMSYENSPNVTINVFQIIQLFGSAIVDITGSVASQDLEIVADQMIASALTVSCREIVEDNNLDTKDGI